MIYRDIAGRGSGKSTRILKEAIATHSNIATFSYQSVKHFKNLAEELRVPYKELPNGVLYLGKPTVSIVAPISYWITRSNSAGNRNKILVDELTACMNHILNGNFGGYSDDDFAYELKGE